MAMENSLSLTIIKSLVIIKRMCVIGNIEMKPYNQGNVDFFCGIYAVMNACRFAGRKYHTFTFNQGCEFYQHMMQFLINNNLLEEVLYHGSSFEIMQMYLAEARDYLHEKYGLKLYFKRPFLWVDMPVKQASSMIAKYLRRENTAAIIRFENKDCGDHWSMIQKCPYPLNKFKLLDSYLYPHLDINSCRWHKDKKCSYVPREGIVFVKVVAEK